MLRLTVDIPSATQLRSDIKEFADQIKNKIITELERVNKVSIALDAWTSPNRLTFLAIVAYYITPNWEYRHVLLGFEELSGQHTGENFAGVVRKVLQQFKIENKVFAVTTDNAKNNDTMTATLVESLSESIEHYDYELYHIRCLAHVVQLVVKEFMDNIKASAKNEILEKVITDKQLQEVKKIGKSFRRTLELVRTFLIALFNTI